MLEVTGSGGTLRQDSFRTHVSRASIALSQVFPTPELELGGRLAIEEFSRASRLISWAATANYSWSDERSMGFVASREPLLPFNPPPSLRQFNRVLDVGALGPGFYVDSLRALADARVGGNPAHVESGAGRFADGNRHLFAYAHYQLPLSTASGRWTVLRPNLFVESFSNKQPFYFSPSRHTTLGAMLHTIRDYQHWNLEVEVNPQLLYTEGRSAFGGHGLVNLVFKSHGTTMAAGTFVFYDSLEDYLQWRLGGRVSVPLKW
jgi:hypothetical protein